LDGTPVCESYGSPNPSELQGSSATTPYVSPATVQGEFASTQPAFVTPEQLQRRVLDTEGTSEHQGGEERWDDIHELGA
jgi:hypothetical protein